MSGRWRWSIWAGMRRSWWSTRPVMSRKAATVWGAASVHRHRGPDRERSGRRVRLLRHHGRAHLIDREVYLPASWTDDPDRLAAAGVPGGTAFATKPQLAARMLARALDAGVPAGWVAGDEVYGNDPALRAGLEARGVGYVLAVACDHPVAPPPANSGLMCWSRGCLGGPGSACRLAAVPRATGSTTGRGSVSPAPATMLR